MCKKHGAKLAIEGGTFCLGDVLLVVPFFGGGALGKTDNRMLAAGSSAGFICETCTTFPTSGYHQGFPSGCVLLLFFFFFFFGGGGGDPW